MRDLCILLIALCLTSLVLSEFASLIIKCNTENDEHLENCSATDQCIWKTSLEKCNTLQLECTDAKQTRCTSFEECGVANETEFVKHLDGCIQCEFYKKSIECTSKLPREHTNFVCNKPYCELKHTIPDRKYCYFSHSFKKCIKENEQFPVKGDLNCTVTHEKKGTNPEGGEKRSDTFLPTPECPPKPGCTEIGYFHATYGLGITLSLVAVGLLFALFKLWKRRRNDRDAAVPIPQSQDAAMPNSQHQGTERERDATPLLTCINIHDAAMPNSQHQGIERERDATPLLTDAAMPNSQHQDAAEDSSLDDPQSNAAVPIPQSQDGTLQMESSQVVKFKVVQEDEKGC